MPIANARAGACRAARVTGRRSALAGARSCGRAGGAAPRRLAVTPGPARCARPPLGVPGARPASPDAEEENGHAPESARLRRVVASPAGLLLVPGSLPVHRT